MRRDVPKKGVKIYSPRAGVTRTRGPGGARLSRVKWAARSAGQQMPIVTIMARSLSAERTPRIRSASVVAAPPRKFDEHALSLRLAGVFLLLGLLWRLAGGGGLGLLLVVRLGRHIFL